MDGRIVITDAACGRTAYIYEDELLAEVHPFSDEEETGSIYIGVVENIVENLKAAFLRIENDEILYYSLEENDGKHIFIKHGKGQKVKKGDWLLVQKIKAAKGNKRAQATADLSLKGRFAVVNRSGHLGISKRITNDNKREALGRVYEKIKNEYADELTDEFGVIMRSASASDISEDEIISDTIKILRKLRSVIDFSRTSAAGCSVYRNQADITSYITDISTKKLYNRLTVITDIPEVYYDLRDAGFAAGEGKTSGESTDITQGDSCNELILYDDPMRSLRALYNIDRTLSIMFGKKIYLKSGGYLVVDLTEALTVIDVNTGKDTKGSSLSEHIFKTNDEAAELIARLLRIRNITGIIIVDFINMKDKDNEDKTIDNLKRYISADHRKCFFVDMTELGLAELTRQRTGSGYILENLMAGDTNNK